ncbi:1-acyl-sn-glycerol-3-phosphate acyltransferase [Gordonia amarae]|uniref:1-acylglycerol-3-phosphate O-acyltransferase n=2 Tax=Gordonia amarae TaxID=36821 RepID=G7GVG5_9ACTN|nr:lysophospholipid acyltransferase family protein [Gordonia amarae]QHN19983.1 1-acyl-sn-glycerol-3-phosphate acyltransferase [Gordonia amarae]QHN24441.1 1-acyl-sn-glycerol-3-phosphate acyltransferase [Gordonia amarae]QHN33366.1 1-acyl-sn-glycerol-3-phosphate acyltransferase [Gordonia amarae]QHN42089.1 1-acyl-sn-glycerol-3-phosphate acyltransferase [Gordonia amarae]GAB07590.1 1-acylglycerol-3-phosphate O-acyltransferase [Gordonia amarae NBRC 15530]
MGSTAVVGPAPVTPWPRPSLVAVPDLVGAASGRVPVPPDSGLHPWFPLSPCGAGCLVGRHDRATTVQVAVRVLRTAAVAVAAACLWPVAAVAPAPVRRRFLRGLSRRVLRSLGLTVVVDDRRPFVSHSCGLIVANHVSYLDIPAVAMISPARFVAKAEIVGTPVSALPARILRAIRVERNSLRRLPGTVHEVTGRLELDESVAVFPEGTTRCGTTTGTFAPAFFQAAVDAGVPVLPIGLAFTTPSGSCPAAAFIGEDTPWDTLRRVLRTRELSVRVTVHESQLPGADRRELAARCARLIAGG